MHKSLIALFCLLLCPLSHAEPIPTEEISHETPFTNFTLSPDGKAVAYSENVQGSSQLRILNLETGEKVGLNLTVTTKEWNSIVTFFWLSDERLAYSTGYHGYMAVNRDGSKNRGLGGSGFLGGARSFTLGSIVHKYSGEEEGRLLVQTIDVSTRDSSSYSHNLYDFKRPGLAKLNGATGALILAEENPGNVVSWLITSEGEVGAAQEIDGTRYRVVYRNPATVGEQPFLMEWEKAKQNELPKWIALPGMDWDDPQVAPLGFGQENRVLYVSRLNEQGRWAIYPYNMETHEFGTVILEDKDYDIIPQTDASGQTGLIYTNDRKRLLGIRYLTAYPRVYWLDQGLGEVQAGLDHALKGKVNSIVSMSDDLQKLIILSWSDRDPGTYYYFDREKQALSVLMKSTPWIQEEQMAKMRPLKFKARDGVIIHGYMNLPVEGKPQNLPLVVLNNGGNWTRNTWYFDRTAQFFANRGYAVLKVNTRGTTGYGDAFKRLSYGKSEEAIADLADAVKWAVSKKLVDPNRVAIIGEGNVAGIRTLTALALHPDVYTCGIVNSPYTDWSEVISQDRFVSDFLNVLRERIGDPNDPNDPISRMSPIQMVDQITAPVLVTETADWKPDYYTYVKKFVKALEASGSQVEFETEFKAKYGFENYAKWLEDAAAFMRKHMPVTE